MWVCFDKIRPNIKSGFGTNVKQVKYCNLRILRKPRPWPDAGAAAPVLHPEHPPCRHPSSFWIDQFNNLGDKYSQPPETCLFPVVKGEKGLGVNTALHVMHSLHLHVCLCICLSCLFVYLFLFCFFSIALHVMCHCTSMRDAVQQKDWSKLGFRFEYWLKMVVFYWFCNRFIFSAGALAALMRHNRSQGHNTCSKSLQYNECNSGSSGYYSRDARISCNKQINATN